VHDSTYSIEVTAYPAPLPFCPVVDTSAKKEHTYSKTAVDRHKSLCKSHTVLVVGNLESMRIYDFPLYKSRLTAAHQTLAVEFAAEQLFKDTPNDSDVVSLIQMGAL
jgi:hypothetical protein